MVLRCRSPGLRAVGVLFLLVALSGSRETEAQSHATQNGRQRLSQPASGPPDPSLTIYLTCFKDNSVQIFSSTGAGLGVFCTIPSPTGVAFDNYGNLFVASDSPPYSIQKFAPDGSGSIFATSGLKGPHGLAFDGDGNLYVANAQDATIEKFTPDGVGTVFADASAGVAHPTDLMFDASGNLFVTNAFGGPTRTGSVEKFTPDGTGTVFADSVFNTAYGIAFDSAGNVYVSNFSGNNVLKFAQDGTNLGVFVSSPLRAPHGMFFDRAGNLYVANNATGRIERFSSTGAYLGAFARTGKGPHFFALSTPTPSPTPPPAPVQLDSVNSTMTQGGRTSHGDGFECRSGGTAGDYTLVLTFSHGLASVESASVAWGSVSSRAIGPNANQSTVSLASQSGCNTFYNAVTLTNVTDAAANHGDMVVTPQWGLLVGDTNADGSVNSGDISQTKAQSGQALGASNFREDVTGDGRINSGGISLVKARSGTTLP